MKTFYITLSLLFAAGWVAAQQSNSTITINKTNKTELEKISKYPLSPKKVNAKLVPFSESKANTKQQVKGAILPKQVEAATLPENKAVQKNTGSSTGTK